MRALGPRRWHTTVVVACFPPFPSSCLASHCRGSLGRVLRMFTPFFTLALWEEGGRESHRVSDRACHTGHAPLRCQPWSLCLLGSYPVTQTDKGHRTAVMPRGWVREGGGAAPRPGHCGTCCLAPRVWERDPGTAPYPGSAQPRGQEESQQLRLVGLNRGQLCPTENGGTVERTVLDVSAGVGRCWHLVGRFWGCSSTSSSAQSSPHIQTYPVHSVNSAWPRAWPGFPHFMAV